MALKEMDKIASAAAQKWNLNKVIIRHAVGLKNVAEPVVVVGASSAHRDACFEACRYLIDTLKETVPIWKKEMFENKTVWVSAHP
jgi:molybdopterin synthase catalytic subunit